MNSKAIKRQLLAAIAMVLVAALALGSSTYAWFVASGTVTAKGMQVQAQSEGGLSIRWAGEESNLWGTSASAKMSTAKELLPTSTADLKEWSYAKASTAAVYTADSSTYRNITKDIFGETKAVYDPNNTYIVMQPFEIRSTSADNKANGLFVSDVKVTSTETKDIDAALRVGVMLINTSGNGAFFIYGPSAQATTSYTWKDSSSATGTAVNLATKGTINDTNSQLLNSSNPIPADKDTPVKVQIFIWYEGEDAKLYSDNFAANGLQVSVDFSSYSFGTTVSGG